jgi:hypothetical protein
MPLFTVSMLQGEWTMGHVICDSWLSVDYLASNASVLNLLVISFDRYFSVTRPLSYRARRTTKRAALMVYNGKRKLMLRRGKKAINVLPRAFVENQVFLIL